jgi:hypothetical protein
MERTLQDNKIQQLKLPHQIIVRRNGSDARNGSIRREGKTAANCREFWQRIKEESMSSRLQANEVKLEPVSNPI